MAFGAQPVKRGASSVDGHLRDPRRAAGGREKHSRAIHWTRENTRAVAELQEQKHRVGQRAHIYFSRDWPIHFADSTSPSPDRFVFYCSRPHFARVLIINLQFNNAYEYLLAISSMRRGGSIF